MLQPVSVKSSPTLGFPAVLADGTDVSPISFLLDTLLHGGPKSATTTAPPAAVVGDTYIVPAGATGVWAPQVGSLAVWAPVTSKDGVPSRYVFAWEFILPKIGMQFYVQDTGTVYIYTTNGWTIEPNSLVASAPANSASAGTKGQIFADVNFLYIAIATNTWRKVAIAAF